jgi:hypothetical protein
MIRIIRLWKRADGVDDNNFRWLWRTRQASLQREVVGCTPIQRVTVSFLTPRQIGSYAPGHQVPIAIDFDAVESYYFHSLTGLRAALASGVLRFLEEAQGDFSVPHPSVPWTVTLEEPMGRNSDPSLRLTGQGDLKTFRTLARKADIDYVQLRVYWHTHHKILEMGAVYRGGPFVINVSFGLGQRIVGDQLVPIDETQVGDNIDATTDIYYPPGTEVWVGYETSPFEETTRRDERAFINFDAFFRRAIMEEYVLADETQQPAPTDEV